MENNLSLLSGSRASRQKIGKLLLSLAATQWSSMIRSSDVLKSTDTRIIVGDIHSDIAGLMLLLKTVGAVDNDYKRLPGFWLVSLGDLLHLGHDSHVRDRDTAEFARGLFDVMLLGNHELWHSHGLDAGRFNGMHNDVFPEVKHMIQSWRDQYVPAYALDGALLTHAGVHSVYLDQMPKDSNARDLERIIARRWKSRLATGKKDPLFDAVSPLRGGASNQVGGLFWADHHEHLTDHKKSVIQIYGHSPQKDVTFSEKNVYCVDVGAALSGKVPALVKQGETGVWTPLVVRTS